MKKKHILKVELAAARLGLEESPDVMKLLEYLHTGKNGCPYTMSHTVQWCGYKGCRES